MPEHRRCAIHQPNFFPRLTTLAKLFMADVWVALDDVQFARRDYQHRARLVALDDPEQQQWLTLPVHRPAGRATRIKELRLAEPTRSARRTRQLIQQYYGRSLHWPLLENIVEPVADLLADGAPVSEVTETSTLAMLGALGWQGTVVRSSQLEARCGRSERLADLAAAVGGNEYLCGTGGARYLDPAAFQEHGISVRNLDFKEVEAVGMRRATGLRAIALLGQASVSGDRSGRGKNRHGRFV